MCFSEEKGESENLLVNLLFMVVELSKKAATTRTAPVH